MIDPSTALRDLFAQHEQLRVIMDDCERLADQVDRGQRDLGGLIREVAKLRVALSAHNRFEEQVLRPILRELVAFGDVRLDHAFAEHIDEHHVLARDLNGPMAELRATVHRVRAHLAAEERYLHSARLLRSDAVHLESPPCERDRR
jgi:hypothetical protein